MTWLTIRELQADDIGVDIELPIEPDGEEEWQTASEDRSGWCVDHQLELVSVVLLGVVSRVEFCHFHLQRARLVVWS